MTRDKLREGSHILRRIDVLTDERNIWDGAKRFGSDQISLINANRSTEVSTDSVDFDRLRGEMITKLNIEIDSLEKKFEAL